MGNETQTSSSQQETSQPGGGAEQVTDNRSEANDAPPPISVDFDNRRNELAKRFRASRDAPPPADEGDGDEGSEQVDDGGEVEEAATAETKTDAPATPKRLTIGGKEYSEEDIAAALARPAVSPELEETRRLLAETRDLVGKVQKPAAEAEPEPAPAAAVKAERKLTAEKIQKHTEVLQTGSVEDGAKAFGELVEDIRDDVIAEFAANSRGAQLTEEEVDRRVEARVNKLEAEKAVRAAVSRFNEEYPEIAAKPKVRRLAEDAARDGMFANWKEAGASDAQIEKYRNKPLDEIANLHHQMMNGNVDKIKSYDAIIKEAVTEVGKEIGIEHTPKSQRKSDGDGKSPPVAKVASQSPQRMVVPPDEAARRADAKRTMQQQPRSAGGRGQQSGNGGQRPRTARDFIQDERKRRHYPTTGR
jgi:hypothetical protein